MKNILIRSDSSSDIGTGHVMRDLVLACQYKNSNIIFATSNLKGNINNKIIEAGYSVEILESNNIDEVNNLIIKYDIDFIVIDSYDIDYKYEKKLKNSNQKLSILSFDDTYEKHYCDILLNHNMGANFKKYKELVPNNCEIRCGEKYTLLRDEFIKEKKKKRKLKNSKNNKKTIFIAMGGADHSNLNIKILKTLNEFDNIKVNIVTTKTNKHIEDLIKYVKGKKWIALHINSNKIAKLMNKSDFAIITPSVILNEVYYMKLPFIAIKTAENQKDIYKYLKNKKMNTIKKFSKEKLKNLIKKMK